MEKRPKMKNHCKWRYFEGFWMPEHGKHCQTCVLDRLHGENRVDYRVFHGKHCKNTVKNIVLEGFLVYMFELASGIGAWKN